MNADANVPVPARPSTVARRADEYPPEYLSDQEEELMGAESVAPEELLDADPDVPVQARPSKRRRGQPRRRPGASERRTLRLEAEVQRLRDQMEQ